MHDIATVVHSNGAPVPLALVTGASRGLGHALAIHLAADGWDLVVDARDADRLRATVAALPPPGVVTAVAGDVADPDHRAALVDVVAAHGSLDLLVNNASTLPGSPQPPLAELRSSDLERTLAVNLVAPHALTRDLLPWLRRSDGAVVDISSDAAVEPYPGWGAYGASKAALDHLTAILAVEHPELDVYAVDPGDLRTDLHQAAFPGEDISDRPLPTTVVPGVVELLARRPPSGRYRLADLMAGAGIGGAT